MDNIRNMGVCFKPTQASMFDSRICRAHQMNPLKSVSSTHFFLLVSFFPPSRARILALKSYHHQYAATPRTGSATTHTSLLVEAFHENRRLKDLIEKLQVNESNPLQILKDDGDWSKDQFWAVVRFLKETHRLKEALQVFGLWKNLEKSRISKVNYEKIIQLLAEAGLMEEAVMALQELKANGLSSSVEIYNSVIHGFAQKGEFDDALFFLKEMLEINLMPKPETYNGLIQAYGNYRMYDEMSKCVKKMESRGCVPDQVTCNTLILEFARGGLVKRMEREYQTLLSKRLDLQPCTLVAMMEAYAKLGVLEKMEKFYRRAVRSKIPLKESLVRNIAGAYIENYMFSRLDDLGLDISLNSGKTDLVWCLRLLSHACVLSRKGMNSIICEMEIARFSWNITVANIILLAYLKMKDFRRLGILFSELQTRNLKPDIVTFGVLFDASMGGFDEHWNLETWRKIGLFQEVVQMNTDPLVLDAFGKGCFLRSCEEMYTTLGHKAREKKVWTYNHLIDMVLKHSERKPQLLRAERN